MSAATLCPPADSPKMVTLSGSPPKPSMLSRTHSSAATVSSVPKFPEWSMADASAVLSAGCLNQPNVDKRY